MRGLSCKDCRGLAVLLKILYLMDQIQLQSLRFNLHCLNPKKSNDDGFCFVFVFVFVFVFFRYLGPEVSSGVGENVYLLCFE